MASHTNSYSFGIQTPPSSSVTPRPRWWSRPIVTYPASYDRKATCTEKVVCYGPCCGGILTVIALFLILLFIDKAHSHAKFSIQTIAIPPSADAPWHVDFFVKNPSSRYIVSYNVDDVSVRLGSLKAAVLNITHQLGHSKDVTAISLVFVGRGKDVVSEQLDVTVRGEHKRFLDYDEAGHFDVTCRNLTLSYDKVICQSTFTHWHSFHL